MYEPVARPPDHACARPSTRQYSRTRRPPSEYQRVRMQRRPSTTNDLVLASVRTRRQALGRRRPREPLIDDAIGVGGAHHLFVGAVDQHV